MTVFYNGIVSPTHFNAMRIILLFLLSMTTLSCSRNDQFDAAAATRWSQTADVQNRTKATSYGFQRQDGSWVIISITPLKEGTSAYVSDGAEILKTGFLVYPGTHSAQTINEAIETASRIPGFHPKS